MGNKAFHLFLHEKYDIGILVLSLLFVQCVKKKTSVGVCVWPTQEIKKPLQLEAYLCVNYLTRVDLNKSETRFSMCSFLTRVVGNNSKFNNSFLIKPNLKSLKLETRLKRTISYLLLVKVFGFFLDFVYIWFLIYLVLICSHFCI